MLTIYKISNQRENRCYIGATRNSMRQRKLDHLERASRGQMGKLYEAIRAYGPEALIWEELEQVDTIDSLAAREKYWIKFYNSKVEGYNSDEGGGFKKSVYQYDCETRQLLNVYGDLQSAANACNANKRAISRAALSVNKLYGGFLWSYKKYDCLPYNYDLRKKKVAQYDLEGNLLNLFDSVAHASRETGVSKTCIARVCRGERNSSKGFKWSYL